ncbi:hypothetical protein [Candidatus Pelagisphaera phototrophica]|uniref:hypothetical protein n=1 Tax=Candidatus Pelagisphaera phototrophica TaxID=2684113 RepID=UPI0019E5143C|nr:hypothetical protein [Candidatus Pelagisphaera phototrophica]QXD32673.1 hypothetical protein GA004_02815 [Candidatus Pelagisphaera phototrophica]
MEISWKFGFKMQQVEAKQMTLAVTSPICGSKEKQHLLKRLATAINPLVLLLESLLSIGIRLQKMKRPSRVHWSFYEPSSQGSKASMGRIH